MWIMYLIKISTPPPSLQKRSFDAIYSSIEVPTMGKQKRKVLSSKSCTNHYPSLAKLPAEGGSNFQAVTL